MTLYFKFRELLKKSQGSIMKRLINIWTIFYIILALSFALLAKCDYQLRKHIDTLEKIIEKQEQIIKENEERIKKLEDFNRRASAVRDYAISLRVSPERAAEVAAEIVRLSDQYGVDYRLITAVAAHESGFRCVRGSVDEWGILQVRPATYRWMMGTSRGFWDWRQNLEAGVKFLAYLSERFNGDTEAILAAYNAGPNQSREKMLRKTYWYRVRVAKNLKRLEGLV